MGFEADLIIVVHHMAVLRLFARSGAGERFSWGTNVCRRERVASGSLGSIVENAEGDAIR